MFYIFREDWFHSKVYVLSMRLTSLNVMNPDDALSQHISWRNSYQPILRLPRQEMIFGLTKW